MGINVYGHITQVTHTTCLSVDSLCVGCSVIGLHYNDIKELDISSCFPDMPRHNVQQSHTVHGTNLISQDASILLKMSLTPNKMSDNSGNPATRENQAHCLKESFFLFFSPLSLLTDLYFCTHCLKSGVQERHVYTEWRGSLLHQTPRAGDLCPD